MFAVEFGDYFTHGLGSASRAGNDVATGGTATTPILCAGTVNGALGSGYRVNGGHQTALNTEAVVQHLSDGSQAVGGAAGVADDGLTGILVGVHAANEHVCLTSVVTLLAGSRENHILGTCFQVLLGAVHGQVETGGFNDILGTNFTPGEVLCFLFSINVDVLTIDDELFLLQVIVNSALEAAMHGVILEHIGHVVNVKQVIDTYYLDFVNIFGLKS